MKVYQEATRDNDGGVFYSKEPEGLSAIHRPDCAAAIWERSPLPRFQAWINSLAPEHLPSSRLILRPHLVHDALLSIATNCGMPKGPNRDLLIDDASALAAIFSDVMRVDYLRVRLDVIGDNACRKFHVDAVTARLICTYRGAGTQYGTSRNGADPEQVFTVPTGAPLILRGTLWPQHPPSGLLHRSPPIEGTGGTRLLLILDPVEEAIDKSNYVFH